MYWKSQEVSTCRSEGRSNASGISTHADSVNSKKGALDDEKEKSVFLARGN
jgi:hypothetical protein